MTTYTWTVSEDGWIFIHDTDPDQIGRPWAWPLAEKETAEAFWKGLQDETQRSGLVAKFIRKDTT